MTALPDFENVLKQAMGLDSVSIGKASIDRSVRVRMARVGAEHPEEYWQYLQRSKEELQELIETVVVPETWFFRDQSAFTALARLAVDEWHPRNPKTAIRLLSIPCSTGEEPYSMVMTLLDVGFSLESIHIDAVDISARALARAKAAVYGDHSFRGRNPVFRDRYFRPVPDGYSPLDRFSGKVRFRQGNLLSADFRLDENPYDVIFCRNLLIYFDRPTQEQVLRKLGGALAPSGYLFVGPAEAFLTSCNGFASINQAMSFAFRKASLERPAAPTVSSRAKAKPKKHLHPRRHQPSVVAPSRDASVCDTPPDLREARRLADAGRLREAAASCEGHLLSQGPSVEAYYILGLVRGALGDEQGAAESYRRTLYLGPNHAEALSHLALMNEAQGEIAAAKRLFERSRRAERKNRDTKP